MPDYSFKYEGRPYSFKYAEELTPEQVMAFAPEVMARADAAHPAKTGILNAVGSGYLSSVGSIGRGIGKKFDIPWLVQAGEEVAKDAASMYEPTDERDKGVINKLYSGFGTGMGLEGMAQGIGGMAIPLAAAPLAAAVPAVGVPLEMGLWGATTAAQSYDKNTQRQEQLNNGKVVDEGAATAAALMDGALAGLIGPLMRGGGAAARALMPKLMESVAPTAAQAAEQFIAGKITRAEAESLIASTAKNMLVHGATATGVGATLGGVSTALTRAQAGQEVFGEGAGEEFKEVGKGALTMALPFSMLGVGARGKQLRQLDRTIAPVEAKRAEAVAAQETAAREEYLASPEGQAEEAAKVRALTERYKQMKEINPKEIDKESRKEWNAELRTIEQQLEARAIPKPEKEGVEPKKVYKGAPDEILAAKQDAAAQEETRQAEAKQEDAAAELQRNIEGIAKQEQRDYEKTVAKFDKELAQAKDAAEKQAVQDKKDAELAAIKAVAEAESLRLQQEWEVNPVNAFTQAATAKKIGRTPEQTFAEQHQELYPPKEEMGEDHIATLLAQEALGQKPVSAPGFVRGVYKNPEARAAELEAETTRKIRLEKSGSLLPALVPNLQGAIETRQAETAAANAEPARRLAAVQEAIDAHKKQEDALVAAQKQVDVSEKALLKRAKNPLKPASIARMEANAQKAEQEGDTAKAERLRKQIGATDDTHGALVAARDAARDNVQAALDNITKAKAAVLEPIATPTQRTYAADYSPKAHADALAKAKDQLELGYQTQNPDIVTEALRTMQELKDQHRDALVGNAPVVRLEAGLGDFGHMLEVVKPREIGNTETLAGIVKDLTGMHARIAKDALAVAQQKATAAGKTLTTDELNALNKKIYGMLDAHQMAVLSEKAKGEEPAGGERSVPDKAVDEYYTHKDTQRAEGKLQEQLSAAVSELRKAKVDAKAAKESKQSTAQQEEIAKTSTFAETAQAKVDAYIQELIRHRETAEHVAAVHAERNDPTFGLHKAIEAAIKNATEPKVEKATAHVSQKIAFDLKRAETPQGKAESRNEKINRLRQELELKAAEESALKTGNVEPLPVKGEKPSGLEGTLKRVPTQEELAAIAPKKEAVATPEKPAPLSKKEAEAGNAEGRLNAIFMELRKLRMRVQRSNEAVEKAKSDEARTTARKEQEESSKIFSDAIAKASGVRSEMVPVLVEGQKGVAAQIPRRDGRFAGGDYLLDLYKETGDTLPKEIKELKAKLQQAETIAAERKLTPEEQTSLNLARQELAKKQTRLRASNAELKRLEADTEVELVRKLTQIKPKEQKTSADFLAEGIEQAESTTQRVKGKNNPAAEIERADMLLKAEKKLNADDAAINDMLPHMSRALRARWEAVYQGVKGEPYALKSLEAGSKRTGKNLNPTIYPDKRREGERIEPRSNITPEATELWAQAERDARNEKSGEAFKKAYGITLDRFELLQKQAATGNPESKAVIAAKAKLAEITPKIEAANAKRALEDAERQQISNLRERISRGVDPVKDQAELDKLYRAQELRSYPEGKKNVVKADQAVEGEQKKTLSEGTKPEVASSPKAARETLQRAFFSKNGLERVSEFHATEADARALAPDVFSQAKGKVQAFTKDGKVHLVTENIPKGKELSVFLHEVGVHLGMKKLVGEANMEWLTKQVEKWAAAKDGSRESAWAQEAIKRAEKSSSTNKREEIVAYMVEAAVRDGVTPTAMKGLSGGFQRWFRTLWAGAKAALRKLQMKSDDFNVQHLVDISMGAARLETAGSWHGTAAEFRKFSHKKMGSGEGAQAFGWGTYDAERSGIAHEYWKADVERKEGSVKFDGKPLEHYLSRAEDGAYPEAMVSALLNMKDVARNDTQNTVQETIAQTIKTLQNMKRRYASEYKRMAEIVSHSKDPKAALKRWELLRTPYKIYEEQIKWIQRNKAKFEQGEEPIGSLMRVDRAIHEDEYLNLDKPLSEQSKLVQKALADSGLPKNLMHNTRMTHGPMAAAIKASGEKVDASLTGKEFLDKLDRHLKSDEAASKYLDSIGIKGSRFMDQLSRNLPDVKRRTAQLEKQVEELETEYLTLPLNDSMSKAEIKSEMADILAAIEKKQKEIARLDTLKTNPTYNHVTFNDKNIVRVMTEVGADRSNIRFSEALATQADLLAPEKEIKLGKFVGKEARSTYGLAAEGRAFNNAASVERVMEHAVDNKLLNKTERTQVLMNLQAQRTIPTLVRDAIQQGMPRLVEVDGVKRWVTPDTEAKAANLASIESLIRGREREFFAWERTKRLEAVGWDKAGIPKDEIAAAAANAKATIAAGSAIPEFVRAREQLTQWNKDLIQMMVSSGRMSKEEAASWKPELYTPLYNVEPNGDIILKGATRPVRVGNINDAPEIKQLLGGNKELMSGMKGLSHNLEVMSRLAITNYATKSTAFMLRDVGLARKGGKNVGDDKHLTLRFYINGDKISYRMDREQGVKNAKEALRLAKTPEQRQQALKMQKMLSDTNYISLPVMIADLSGTAVVLPAAMKVLSLPMRIVHTAITRNPAYPIRQLLKDLPNIWTMQGADSAAMLGTFKTIVDVWRGKDVYAEKLRRMGAASSNIMTGNVYGEHARMAEALNASWSGGLRGMWDATKVFADKWATSGELAVRSQLVKSGLKQGMTETEALLYSIEAGTNFSKRGSSKSLFIANQLTPFVNSAARGLDVAVKALRGMSEGQEKTQAFQKLLLRASMVTTAALIQHALLSDEDWYNQIGTEERISKWWVKMPGWESPLGIPISYESGFLFKAMPELFATLNKDRNGLGQKEFFRGLAAQVVSNIMPGGGTIVDVGENGRVPVPLLGFPGTAMSTVLGWLTGQNLQTGIPIVGKRLEGLPDVEQYDEDTSAMAKQLGAELGVSPKKIDFAISGVFSTIGLITAQALGRLVETPQEGVSKPDTRWSDNPILKGFSTNIDRNAVASSLYEDVINKPEKAALALKRIADEEMNPEKAMQYVQDHPEIDFAQDAARFRKDLGELEKEKRVIPHLPDKDFPPEVKRKMLNDVRATIRMIGEEMVKTAAMIREMKQNPQARFGASP